MHFTPVHCSWMNQVEQWFSILQRQRLSAPNFCNLADLETKIDAFVADWNATAHPFQWTRRSFDKVLAKADAEIRRTAGAPCNGGVAALAVASENPATFPIAAA